MSPSSPLTSWFQPPLLWCYGLLSILTVRSSSLRLIVYCGGSSSWPPSDCHPQSSAVGLRLLGSVQIQNVSFSPLPHIPFFPLSTSQVLTYKSLTFHLHHTDFPLFLSHLLILLYFTPPLSLSIRCLVGPLTHFHLHSLPSSSSLSTIVLSAHSRWM